MDLDRDANVPVPGSSAAGSADRGDGTSPRFSSAERGLKLLTDLFDELHVPATFFAEARTLCELRDSAGLLAGFEVGVHGYDHEDLSLLAPGEADSVITRAAEAAADVTGRRPVSFRAPYMKAPEYLRGLLASRGFTADSSSYAPGDSCVPRLAGGVWEVPVCRGPGGRTSYLWPMHEGRRDPGSYTDLADTVREGGVYVLCDHCWHMVEHCDGSLREDTGAEEKVRQVITSLLDRGFVPCTVLDCVGRA